MMRVMSITFLLLLRLVFQSDAFVSPQKTVRQQEIQLQARVLPPIPPPPPPPTPDGDFSLDKLVADVAASLQSMDIPKVDLSDFDLRKLEQTIQAFDTEVFRQSERLARNVEDVFERELPLIQPLYQTIASWLAPLVQSPALTLLVSATASYLLISTILSTGEAPPPAHPYPNGRYDPVAARTYFDRRLHVAVWRALQILTQALLFGTGILKDKLDNKLAENEFQRGRELAELLTRLGPTFIKVGQSLSIRTDLLSPGYVRGLSLLQDQVAPFSTAVAVQILEREWGKPVENVLATPLTDKPIAAASLGQVYKAKLKSTGQEVAIKVQRPDITEQIALDMHIVREFAPIVKSLFKLNTDLVGLVDAWGTGFVDELDYLQEARNAQFFSEQILRTPLSGVVFAPSVVEKLTTGAVLVTEWVDGERLDRSSNEDVSVLCSVAMNTYLTMLLEVGLLHCDPHPGNLFRTPDGRLCILDWGMVTRIDKNLQLTLIEHMAHLVSADYAEIPRDLLLLDFIPKSKADKIADSGVVDLLADIYGAWASGGGAAAINVNEVVVQLQELQAAKGSLFQIPPYFAYIAKSFSVLEGIGLSSNPKYSIINECLPYVSKRLLTDQDMMGPALSTFIFGPDKSNPDRIVNYDRVEQLVEGFGQYTTSASGALIGKDSATRTELLEAAADQILDLVFTEEETPLQAIVLEQTAKVMSASGRAIFTRIRERTGIFPSGRTVLGTIVDPLGLWRTSPIVRMNEHDERTIETTLKLIELLQKQIRTTDNSAFDLTTLTPDEALSLSSILARKVWKKRMGVLHTSNRFARAMLQITAETLEQGQRDSRLLPPPKPKRQHDASFIPKERNGLRTWTSKVPVSPRLKQARQRLQNLQFDDKRSTEPRPNVIRVKDDFP